MISLTIKKPLCPENFMDKGALMKPNHYEKKERYRINATPYLFIVPYKKKLPSEIQEGSFIVEILKQ